MQHATSRDYERPNLSGQRATAREDLPKTRNRNQIAMAAVLDVDEPFAGLVSAPTAQVALFEFGGEEGCPGMIVPTAAGGKGDEGEGHESQDRDRQDGEPGCRHAAVCSLQGRVSTHWQNREHCSGIRTAGKRAFGSNVKPRVLAERDH